MRTTVVRVRGYTLVELVTVIALLAIIAGFAAPRFFDQRVFAERGYADELAAAVRLAQKVAVASGCPVRIEVDAAGYRAMQQAAAGGHCDISSPDWTTPVISADGQTLDGSSATDVSATPDTVVTFDGSGRAIAGAGQPITIGPRTLRVEAQSGLVTVT